MLALLFNLDLSEIAIVLVGAILVFGRNLPQVAMRGAAQFVRIRRQLMQVWRESGFEEELRNAQRELESAVPRLPPPQSLLEPLAAETPHDDPGDRDDLAELPSWEDDDSYGPRVEDRRLEQEQQTSNETGEDSPA